MDSIVLLKIEPNPFHHIFEKNSRTRVTFLFKFYFIDENTVPRYFGKVNYLIGSHHPHLQVSFLDTEGLGHFRDYDDNISLRFIDIVTKAHIIKIHPYCNNSKIIRYKCHVSYLKD